MAPSNPQNARQHMTSTDYPADVTRSPHLLAGVAEAARKLLAIEDFDAAVNGTLETLARSANIDRIFVLQHHSATDTAPEFATCPYEWTLPGVPLHRDVPGRFPMVYGEIEGFSEWIQALKAGEPVQKLKREMSAKGQALQDVDQALSVLTVPIFIEGEYWGSFGFDDCTTERVWGETEIAVLETAAATFAAALQRRGSVETLRSRDALLDSVNGAAQVLVANENLNEAIAQALRILGEGTRQDRVYVFENVYPNGPDEVFWDIPYEWTTCSIPLGSEVAGEDIPIAMASFPSEIVKPFFDGQTIQFLTRELRDDARELNEKISALSMLAVPIYVQGLWWGVLGFDDCTIERVWSEAEIAVLETAAGCVGSAIERDRNQKARMAQIAAHNQALAERDRILEATAAAANVMLVNNDFESAVNEALKIVGEGLDVDRVNLGKYFKATSFEEVDNIQFLYEWNVSDTIIQAAHPEFSRITNEGIELVFEMIESGRIFGGVVDDLAEPFRSIQIELGVQSTYSIPVHVSGQCWGILGLDDCHRKTRRSESELEALKTLANCIGSTIERDCIQQAREQAERTALIGKERAARADELEAANKVLKVRDRWLQTTAAAANKLLSATDVAASVDAALATIGENLECDRLSVMRYLADHDSHPLGAMKSLYEWGAAGIRSQKEDSELQVISAAGLEDWFDQFLKGECIGGNVSNMAEPARSGQTALGVLSTYSVPIFIDGLLWGIVAMDYCHEEKQLAAPELAVFQTAATCVGSAIHQAQIRQNKAEKAVLAEREKAARERAAELAKTNEAVSRTLETLAANPELDNFLCLLVQELSEIVGAHNTGLFLYEAESNMLRRHVHVQDGKAYIGPVPRDAEMLRHPFPADITDIWRLIVESPQPITFAETGAPEENPVDLWWEDTVAWHISEGHRQLACARLKVGNIPLGFIGFCFREQIVFSDEKLELVQALANQATLAIHLTHLAEEAKQAAILQEQEKATEARAAELAKTNEAIAQTLTTLTETPELDEFLGQILIKISEPIEACKAHLFLYDKETDTLNQHIAVEDGQAFKGSAPNHPDLFRHPIPVDLSPAWEHIVNSPKPWTLDESNPGSAELWWPESLPWHRAEGHRAATCACMRIGNKPIGFIGFAFRHIAVLTDEQLEFIQALTNQATLSIQLTRLAEEAKQAAILQEQEKAARDRAAELAKANESIGQTLTNLAARPKLDEFLGYILAEMSNQVEACKAHLFLYDAPTHTLTQRVAVQDGEFYLGTGPSDPEVLRHPVPADITTAWELMINSSQPLTYDDAQPFDETIWWPNTVEWHRSQGHKALTCIPMKAGDQPIGYIGFAFYNRTFLSDEQLEFIQALANQAIVAIQLTRLGEEAKQAAVLQAQEKAASARAAELAKTNQALSQTLDALTTEPELDRFLGQILTQIVEQIGADDTHLFLYDEATDTLRSHIAVQDDQIYRGYVPDAPPLFHQPFPANITPTWQIAIELSVPITLETHDPDSVQYTWPTVQPWHEARGHQSATCFCLKVGSQPIGLVGFAFCDRSTLTEEQLEFIQALINQATLAIHLTRLGEEAKQAAVLQAQEKAASARAAELTKTNQALSQTLDVLTTEPELDRFLGQILTQIVEQIGADDTHLFLYDEATDTLRSHIAVQDDQVYLGHAPNDPELFYQPFPTDITDAWQMMTASREPLIFDEIRRDVTDFYWPTTLEWHEARGHQSAACICLKVGSQPIGLIGFAFRSIAILTTEQIEFIQALTNQATLSIHLTQLADQSKAAALSVALTEERNRLAREIHDTLAQAFTGVSLQLEAARSALTKAAASVAAERDPLPPAFDQTQTFILRARDLSRQGLSEARRSVRALRSQALETDTLPTALRKVLNQINHDTHLDTQFYLEGTPEPLPDDIQLHLLRISQEAITNALRHAQATQIDLTLAFEPREIQLRIVDDGIGFTPSSQAGSGFGLVGIRERVARFHGTFQLSSSPGVGTTIEVTVPFPTAPSVPPPAIQPP
ncbi:GAF domain protein [Synechococcus sp. PCC 7335]|uniref:GAF domain-containing protein n=1 Tax=Synechococcus sp. (strain ATCC 29403 / PCC 7335) TaxID=91464 RepID=UPI00017ECEB9|nr:GAF domain-containing protein [Synechococcus sp. PCC 7335]EDX87226.1 GAF domain protein [Synechococcus sp. PCC 7335]